MMPPARNDYDAIDVRFGIFRFAASPPRSHTYGLLTLVLLGLTFQVLYLFLIACELASANVVDLILWSRVYQISNNLLDPSKMSDNDHYEHFYFATWYE